MYAVYFLSLVLSGPSSSGLSLRRSWAVGLQRILSEVEDKGHSLFLCDEGLDRHPVSVVAVFFVE